MAFPDNCIRGIPNETYVNADGTLGSHLFYFDDQQRPDGWMEQSINWMDDSGAIDQAFAQARPEGDLQFRAGIAIIPREEVDRISERPTVRGIISYERQPLPANPYHGNLLLRGTTPKKTMKLIAAGLALAVAEIMSQPVLNRIRT
jgi:hypothetical protein